MRIAAQKKSSLATRSSGWILVEAVVAIGILVTILGGFSMAMQAFQRINSYHLARQQCLAAAEAQLDSLTAVGRPVPAEEIERLWPDVRTAVQQKPGEGDWEGLNLVKVTAKTERINKTITVSLSRYIHAKPEHK
jgi:type II secretory pathway pseudopilin PulG